MTTPALTTQQLADRLGLAPITLQAWRRRHIGIPYFHEGRRVYYRLDAVQLFERHMMLALLEDVLKADHPLLKMHIMARSVGMPSWRTTPAIADVSQAAETDSSVSGNPYNPPVRRGQLAQGDCIGQGLG